MCPESYIDDGCSDAIEHCLLERTLAWNVISLWTVTSAAADVRRGRLLYAGSSDVRIKVDMFIIISNTFLFYIWKKIVCATPQYWLKEAAQNHVAKDIFSSGAVQKRQQLQLNIRQALHSAAKQLHA